jgi:hypothetical protein
MAFSLFGAHDHALRDRVSRRRHRLGRLLDVDEAHAAVGRDRELLVVAEVRDVRVRRIGRMHDHAALGDRDLLAVEFDFNHESLRPAQTDAGTRQVLCST